MERSFVEHNARLRDCNKLRNVGLLAYSHSLRSDVQKQNITTEQERCFRMSKANPITNLTPAACEQVLDLMLAACAKIAAEHGLVIEGSKWRPQTSGLAFETGFRVSVPGREGEERKREKEIFALAAEHIGLKATDFEREFTLRGERFRVTGIDPRRPKYPISAERISDRQACKFPLDEVVKLLKEQAKP